MEGNYLYNNVLSLVDYCGDIKANRQQYSQKYSPNNIRRLYLSPDGAMVMYHINAGVGLTKTVSFNNMMFEQCKMQANYIPMLYVLSADRVCASIEEVIICQKGVNGGLIDNREMSFEGLIKSYKGSGSDLKDAIMNRYKRLHSFIVYNGTLQELINNTKELASSLHVLTESDFIKSRCQVAYFHTDDWYKGYGFSAKFYILDRQGSPLNAHFLSVIQRIESSKKTNDYNKFKEERIKGIKGEFETKYEQALQLIRGYTKLRVLEKTNGGSIFGCSLPKEKFLTIYNVGNLGKTPNLVKLQDIKGDVTKDAYEQNKKLCSEYAMSFYSEMVGVLLNILVQLQNRYPIMVREILSDIGSAIRIPPNLSDINSQLAIPFDGKRWEDSLINLFLYINVLCIGDNTFDSKERWSQCIS